MIALVGNKSDLKEEAEVTVDEGVKKAKDEGVLFMQTSAKTFEGIEELFNSILDILVRGEENTVTNPNQVQGDYNPEVDGGIELKANGGKNDPTKKDEKKKRRCC